MRRACLVTIDLLILVLLAGPALLAQDTNFSTGPQYLMNHDLMNHGSPLFARSIATPHLTFSSPALETGATAATAGLSAGAQDQSTISHSDAALPPIDLFPIYYGYAPEQDRPQKIEISFRANSPSWERFPASIQDAGVTELTTPEALRDRGYGLTLGEAARQSKTNLRHSPRIYTNADIDQLHSH